jgi:Tol biopolymer transport system component
MRAKRRNQRSADANCNRPGRHRIAFTSNRDGDFEVWVMNADGTNPIDLTRNTTPR